MLFLGEERFFPGPTLEARDDGRSGYEPHVCDALQNEHGVDPRTVSDDDVRWLKFRARYITKLREDLRAMLPEESKKQGSPIKVAPFAFANEQ